MCQVLSYNVANLNSKNNFSNFYSYIKSFDIFFLFETHVINEKRSHFCNKFNEYMLYWVDAKKTHSVGRASGGCLYGFKKSIEKTYSLKFQSFGNNVVLNAKFNSESVSFLPRYLNCTNWSNDFMDLECFLNNFQNSTFCLVGDLNARIGEIQTLDADLMSQNIFYCARLSKDKTVDWKGRKLIDLMDNVGGIILNGRLDGDRPGNFTFCGSVGSSVIDYGICSFDFLKFVDKISVGSKPYSDHMPLILNLLSTINVNQKTCSLPPKLKWNQNKHGKYCESLELFPIMEHISSTEDVDTKLQSIVNKVNYGADKIKNTKYFVSQNRWFDCRCEAAKKT